ncbi:hypothetical protein MBLNU457_4638t1 [Dothideomycetes sp. NU457]
MPSRRSRAQPDEVSPALSTIRVLAPKASPSAEMPSLRSKSKVDEVSPADSTIHVSSKRKSPPPVEEPLKPVKKLKLNFRKQDAQETGATEVADARPKRKSSRPSRYSEITIEEKPVQESPSSIKTVSPKVTSVKAVAPGPAPPSPSKSDTSDGEEPTRPADYGMDFLMSYIEDSPTASSTPPPAHPHPPKKIKLLPQPKEKPKVNIRPLSTPQAIAPNIRPSVETTPTTPHQPPQTITISSGPMSQGAMASINTSPAFLPEESPIKDDAPTIIRKLQTAIHALSGLNVPSPPRPLITDDETSSSKAQPEPESFVDALLLAAGADSPEPAKEPPRDLSKMTGTLDLDLRILINNAVQLLRSSMVAKVHLNAIKPRGRPKRDAGISAAIEADRFAMTSLEAVAKSNAINVNCIMTPQRANLTWHLYISLVYLVTPPQQMQMMGPFHGPPPFDPRYGPQNAATMVGTHMHPSHMPQAQLPLNGQAPHQFLLRDQQNMHPGPANHVSFDRVKMYTPGYVPRGGQRVNLLERSGQTLNLMFQQPMSEQLSPIGVPYGHPATNMMPPPGVAFPPGMPHVIGGSRTSSTPPVMSNRTNGAPPAHTPEAVVQDR